MQFIDLKAQYNHLRTDIDAAIQNVLQHGQYIMGPEVKEFEQKLESFVGIKNAIGVANGTDALQLAMMALDVKPGDAIFTSSFSFFATAEVISLAGATPIFVDIDPSSYNICIDSLKDAIAKVKQEGKLTPKAIIAVDLFGLPADYFSISEIAKENNLKLIEDGAQGFGGEINGEKACSFGDIATTSFFPAKPLGCYGDGGAVFSNDDELAGVIRSLRVHGKGSDKYDNIRVGLNSRLDTLQAAILIEKLNVFPNEVVARNKVAEIYSEALQDKFIIPAVSQGYLSSWAQYTLIPKVGAREQFMSSLKEAGIPTVIYYGKPLHKQTVYSDLKQYVDLSNSEFAASNVFSLPMHPYLEEREIATVLEQLIK